MSQLVSVVVPVYNTERYLSRCIDSIMMQEYTNIEIILVDDGSSDKSSAICDEYAQKDARIKVIHKKNGGVSSARNAGLDVAKGTYVCFVDSDDVLLQNGIGDLYRTITETQSQYATGRITSDPNLSCAEYPSQVSVIDLSIEPQKFLESITMPGSYSPYAKIFVLDVFNANGLRFDENLKCSEDALLVRQYLKHCQKIAAISCFVYFYNISNENSLSKKGYPDFALYYSKKMEALTELVETLPLAVSQKNQFLNQRAVHGLNISIQHYLFNFSNRFAQISLVDKALEVLSPWLYLDNINKDFYLYKWWKRNAIHAKKQNCNKLIRSLYAMKIKRELITIAKKILKMINKR